MAALLYHIGVACLYGFAGAVCCYKAADNLTICAQYVSQKIGRACCKKSIIYRPKPGAKIAAIIYLIDDEVGEREEEPIKEDKGKEPEEEEEDGGAGVEEQSSSSSSTY